MNSYSTDEYKSTKKKLKLISACLILVGVSMLVIGGSTLFTAITSFPDSSSASSFSPGEMMGSFYLGGLGIVIGFSIFGFGIQLFMTANARAISKYAATEAAPATSIITEAVASGLSKGLKGSNIGLGSSGREVIKVKCRNCGYLETEDADFCSKCGKQV